MAPSVTRSAGLALLSLASIASAKGTVSLSLDKRLAAEAGELPAKHGIYKRSAGTVQENVFDALPWSGGGAYYTNVTVGTPPQLITVILDTGSSDLYFDASSSQPCEASSSNPNSCRGGSFDSSKSSTYKVIEPGAFNTSFGDGSTAAGDYSTDYVGIGDVRIGDVQFGAATEVDATTGFAISLMGVGYSFNEAAEVENAPNYPNMPSVLQQAGVINSRLFSVYLSEPQNPSIGSILFGGVDTSLYTGELQTLDMLPVQLQNQTSEETQELVFNYILPITGVSVTANGKTTSILENANAENALPVLLDTGSAAWTVPQQIFNELALKYPGLDPYEGTIPCSHASDDILLNVTFSDSLTIQVPASSVMSPLYYPNNNSAVTDGSEGQLCSFMIVADTDGQQMQEQGFLTLGDAVLRAMYVVFDLDNGQLSIAQANANPGTSNVKVVPAGRNGVASAVGSGVATAAPNTYSIDPEITASSSFVASTVSPAIGDATGIDAVPNAAQVSGGSGSGSGSGGSGSSGQSPSATGKSAAASLRPEPVSYLPLLGVWLASAVFGFGLYLF